MIPVIKRQKKVPQEWILGEAKHYGSQVTWPLIKYKHMDSKNTTVFHMLFGLINSMFMISCHSINDNNLNLKFTYLFIYTPQLLL